MSFLGVNVVVAVVAVVAVAAVAVVVLFFIYLWRPAHAKEVGLPPNQ